MKSFFFILSVAFATAGSFGVANPEIKVEVDPKFLDRYQAEANRAIRLAKKECIESALELGPVLQLSDVTETSPMRYTYEFTIKDDSNKKFGKLSIKRKKGPKKFTVFYECTVTPTEGN